MASRNGTMESGVSAQAFQLQQQNLQQLQNLESNFQHSRSFTSSERRALPDGVINGTPAQAAAIDQIQQRNTQQSFTAVDPRNPFSISVPTHSNPTEILASRFLAWISIIKSLSDYLNDVASIQEEIVRQQQRLRNSYRAPVFSIDKSASAKQNPNSKPKDEPIQASFFLPTGNGSIQDLPQLLKSFHHSSEVLADKAVKELRNQVLPSLDNLKQELSSKVREIRALNSDFKNSVNKEVAETRAYLQHYLKSIEEASSYPKNVQPKNDPHLIKIVLDKQIRRQLVEENFLHDAYINLQGSAKELEKVVVITIQDALTVYAKLLGQQAQNVFDQLIRNLDLGFLTKQPSFEWDQFIAKDKNFIDENLPKRSYKDIQYDKQGDPLALEIRSSYLERRSKFLKSYSRGYYVLTPTFFHEFKTSDRKKDLIPVMSLAIDEIELEEHSKRDSPQHKFVVKKVGKLTPHKFVFRTESYETMIEWFNDLKNLKSLNSAASRGAYALKHHTTKTQISRVSSATSRVTNSINNDTVLSLPNNNQTLPHHSNSPLSQALVDSNGVYYKQVGGDGNSHFTTSSPQQQIQRQSLPPQQSQQRSNHQQRFSLQYPPPQQSNNAPYPTGQYLDPRFELLQQQQQQFHQQQQQQLLQPGFSEQQYLPNHQIPGLYVEAPTPSVQNGQSTPQQVNGYRHSIDFAQNSIQDYSQSNLNEPEPDVDGSGFSEDTIKTSAKKETHTGDDSFDYQSSLQQQQQQQEQQLQQQQLQQQQLQQQQPSIQQPSTQQVNQHQRGLRSVDSSTSQQFRKADLNSQRSNAD